MMNKFIVVVILSLFSVLAQAQVQVEVDPSQVTQGEAFRLTITQDSPQGNGIPDLTVLQTDFVILGTERHVSYTVINGQAKSVNQWIVALEAKKTGILTIPSIKFGTDSSTPLTINVQVKATNSSNQDQQFDPDDTQDVQLTAQVSEKKPYVNQQVIYTVRLYNSKRLLDADYQGPQVEDALLIPLGDTKRYQTIKNNTNYVVEEQNYAIFPQKSGPLTVKSARFNALVYDINPQKITAQDQPVELTVLPVPKEYKGQTWLPAKQIKLTEQYENTNQSMDQGSTLTRTVTFEGVAVPAQLLPILQFPETDAFNVYPEKGKEDNKFIQGQLVGSITFKVTYLFNKTGKVTIPELKVPWFNTETGKEEVAVLPPRSMEITPSTAASTQPSAQQTVTNDRIIPQESVGHEMALPAPNDNHWAWVVAFIFALAWIVTLGSWGWQRRSRLQGKGQYKNALNELDMACTKGDPVMARDALLKWAALHWPDAPLLNLTDLTKLVRDVHLKKQLNLLSQVLYRKEGASQWRGDELLRSVHAIKRVKPRAKRKSNSLPPMNPY